MPDIELASYQGQQEITEAIQNLGGLENTLNAANNAERAKQYALSAGNSASSASATATQLMEYLEDKEELTAPAVDPTLSISGAAADAKVTGNKIRINASDMLDTIATFTDGSRDGIDYTWDARTCTLDGTSGSNTFNNIFYGHDTGLDKLPNGIKAGDTIYVRITCANSYVALGFYFYGNDGLISITNLKDGYGSVTVPSGCVGMNIRVRVTSANIQLDNVPFTINYMDLFESNGVLQNKTDEIVAEEPFYRKYGTGVVNELYNISWTEGSYISDNGTVTAEVGTHYSDFAPIDSGTWRVVADNDSGSNRIIRVHGYDANKQNPVLLFKKTIAPNTDFAEYQFIVTNSKYVRVSCKTAQKIAVINLTKDLADLVENFNAYDIYSYDFAPTSGSLRGVTYTWSGRTCTANSDSGGATGYSASNLFHNTTALPLGLPTNVPLYFDFVTTDKKLYLEVLFYVGGSYNGYTQKFYEPGVITIPSTVTGLSVRLRVNEGDEVTNAVCSLRYVGTVPSQSQLQQEIDKINIPYNSGLLVSFIDDDATNDELVTKYYQACKHNGIVGNYAVIKSHLSDGDTSLSKLLEYEDDGFGMLTHCTKQTNAPYWQKATRDIDLCRADLCEAVRYFRANGFVNGYHLWVSPYGDKDAVFEKLARQLSFKCNISLVQGANYPQNTDRYCLVRASMTPNQDISVSNVKTYADQAVAKGYGWLIVCTHFNEWGDVPWDSTLDDDGYPVGYSAFNTMVQYVLGLGFRCVSVPEGFSYYEPYLHN